MSDQTAWTFRESATADAEPLELFLAPFVARRQVLPRSRQELERLTANGFVTETEGRLVGFAAVEVYSRKLAELQCLAVDEAYRGRGMARQLIRACVRRAADLGVVELMAITASESLFESCGFHFSLPDQKKAVFIRPQDEGT